PARRIISNAHLRGGVHAGSDRAAARRGSARSRVRRLRGEARAPGARREQDDARGARRDQKADRDKNGRRAMTPLLDTTGWALIHFVWQGAAIAAATGAILRLLRNHSARARYAVACAGLAVMLAAPTLTARLLIDAARADEREAETTLAENGARPHVKRGIASYFIAEGTATVGETVASPSWAALRLPTARLERLLPAIAIAWLVGVAVLLARMAGGWWHVRRLHLSALASSSSRWQTACRRLAYRLRLPAAAHVVETTLVDVPMVVGWLRPAILLPVAALASLSTTQIEAILAHELAHIRRHDYAVNVLQTIVETLL